MIPAISIKQLKRGFILPAQGSANEDLYRQDLGRVNFYSATTQFYVNALWGQAPRGKINRKMIAAFADSTMQRSINGAGAVIRLNEDDWHAPSGRWIFNWQENGIHFGWIVGSPFATDNTKVMPDRIRLFIYENGKDAILAQDWELTGNTLGNPAGQVLGAGRVSVWGNGESDYPGMIHTVDMLNKRLDKNDSLLDRHSSPHLKGPMEAASSLEENALSKDGAFLPQGKESANWEYLTWDTAENLNKFHINTLLDVLSFKTGVPMTAFGLAEARESGTARERQMFAAISKVRRWRRDIEEACEVFDYLPDWVDDPFTSWMQQIDMDLRMVQAGLLSGEEFRLRNGIAEHYGAKPPEPEPVATGDTPSTDPDDDNS